MSAHPFLSFLTAATWRRAACAAVLLVLSLIFKQNFFALIGAGGAGGGEPTASGPVASTPEEDKRVEFVLR